MEMCSGKVGAKKEVEESGRKGDADGGGNCHGNGLHSLDFGEELKRGSTDERTANWRRRRSTKKKEE